MNSATPTAELGLRRAQVRLSLILLTVMAATMLAVGVLSRSRWLEARLVALEVDRFRRNIEHCMNRGLYLEFEDRLLLREIPRADYSQGGVFFLGTSALKWALQTWEITPDQRPYVADYGIGASDHRQQLQFIRFLAEQRGFLQAGARTHLVLGAYWTMGMRADPESFFGPLWERYGLYSYDPDRGIQSAGGPRWLAWLREERARTASFLAGLANRTARLAATSAGLRLTPTERIDAAKARERARRQRIEGWQEPLAEQMAALESQIRYVRRHQAQVTVVLVPTRAAYRDQPLPRVYRQEVTRLCQRLAVPLVDLSELLREDEFWDMNHSNYAGIRKTHTVLMAMASEHLRQVGLWPKRWSRYAAR